MNSPEIKEYIQKRYYLFWYIKDDKKENISPVLLVETILNYGSADDIKELFNLIGIDTVADIFYKAAINRNRTNYFRPVINYFNLFFQRNAHRYPV